MAGAIERFTRALEANGVSSDIIAHMMRGYEHVSDRSAKVRRAAFFVHAVEVMDELLDWQTRCAVREACRCSTGGWRADEVRKVARACRGKRLEEKLEALWQVKHMGQPVLNADGTITAGIGQDGGFRCPCPVFTAWPHEAPVSPTYCLCCAGHFRHHYQVALGLRLRTKAVVSSALGSCGAEPCRFLYEIEDH
jgi:hypothetical protein